MMDISEQIARNAREILAQKSAQAQSPYNFTYYQASATFSNITNGVHVATYTISDSSKIPFVTYIIGDSINDNSGGMNVNNVSSSAGVWTINFNFELYPVTNQSVYLTVFSDSEGVLELVS